MFSCLRNYVHVLCSFARENKDDDDDDGEIHCSTVHTYK